MEAKRCKICGIVKSYSEYHKGRSIGGRHTYCKDCYREWQRAYRQTPAGILSNRRGGRAYYTRTRPQQCLRGKLRRQRIGKAYRAQLAKLERQTPRGKARQAVLIAVRRATMRKPNRCQCCGRLTSRHLLDAHHEDYTKPLDVLWLCRVCHGLTWRLEDPL